MGKNSGKKVKAGRKASGDLSFTLFDSRPKVGGLKLWPLTVGRLALLEEKGNPLIKGMSEGDEVPRGVVFEIFFVCAKDSKELAKAVRLEDEDWRDEVAAFGFDLSNETLTDFWEVLEKEMAVMRRMRAEPVKKKAKRRRG